MQTKEFKVLLLGGKKIGKTKFLKKLSNNYKLSNDYAPTIGVDVTTKDIICDNKKIRLNIWDTAGDSRFLGLKEMYYLGADLAIIFRNSLNDSHLIFENKLTNNIKKLYIDNSEYSLEYYKSIICDILSKS
jgi:Ras-related protein Rab-32